MAAVVVQAFASAGIACLGFDRLHQLRRSRAAGLSAVRGHVCQSPTLQCAVPSAGVSAIVVASVRGVPDWALALVVVGAAAFTWVAWEAVMAAASSSPSIYHLITRWEERAIHTQRKSLEVAEGRWRDTRW